MPAFFASGPKRQVGRKLASSFMNYLCMNFFVETSVHAQNWEEASLVARP